MNSVLPGLLFIQMWDAAAQFEKMRTAVLALSSSPLTSGDVITSPTSSAKTAGLYLFNSRIRLSMYIENSCGPRTLPWGTPTCMCLNVPHVNLSKFFFFFFFCVHHDP